MTNNQTITLPQGEFAAYQRAIESAKDRIALLVRERDEARQREKIATETYNGQQQSYRELETLYQAAQGRALEAEADAAAFRERVVATCRIGGGGLYAIEELLKEPHPGTALLAELTLLRELADDLTRWREAGGDIRDLTYVFEMMDRYAAMKGGTT